MTEEKEAAGCRAGGTILQAGETSSAMSLRQGTSSVCLRDRKGPEGFKRSSVEEGEAGKEGELAQVVLWATMGVRFCSGCNRKSWGALNRGLVLTVILATVSRRG